MNFKGYFSVGAETLLYTKIDPTAEVISNLKEGFSSADDIYDAINEKYENADNIAINWKDYITVKEGTVRIDLSECDNYYVHFDIDCYFDMDRFARDNNLVEKSQDLEM